MRKTFFSHAFTALFLKKNSDVDGRSAGLRGCNNFPVPNGFCLAYQIFLLVRSPKLRLRMNKKLQAFFFSGIKTCVLKNERPSNFHPLNNCHLKIDLKSAFTRFFKTPVWKCRIVRQTLSFFKNCLKGIFLL